MIDRILYALRLKRPPGFRATREDMLNAIPVRNASVEWEKDSKGEVSLVIRQKDKLWVKIVSKIFMVPSSRVVALDEIGSFVWDICDGTKTVNDVIEALSKRYNLTRKEAEVSLIAFFKQLGKRGFMGFAVNRKVVDRRK